METFKTKIEALKLNKIKDKFPTEDLDWINKFWYKSGIEFTKGRSAAQIEKNIITYIKLLGHHAEKHSVTGRETVGKDVHTALGILKGKKTYIPSQSQKGSADITSTIFGISLKIEVKKGRDKQSADQIKYESEIKSAGGFYMIAHDEQDFLNKFEEFLKLPQIEIMKKFTE